jgi:hypothetical protein
MAHLLDGKLITDAGYEPKLGDPVVVRGTIQEIANGVIIITSENGSLVSAVADMVEYDSDPMWKGEREA